MKSASVPVLNLPTSIENGWVIENVKICTELMLCSSVPDTVIELTRCKCKKRCKINPYSCDRVNLVYTDSCCCNDLE